MTDKGFDLDALLKTEMSRKKFLTLSAATVASAFGITGVLRELASHAATPTGSVEAEGGTIGGNAAVVSDTTASGGRAVKFGTSSSSLLPAHAGNTGYKNAPGYSGTLTAGSTITSGQTYNHMAFQGPISINASNVTFNGCRFYGHAPQNALVQQYGDNNTFNYCTFEPDFAPFTPGIYISEANSYEYGIDSDGGYGTHSNSMTMRNCDFWGWGNAITLDSHVGPFLFDTCWFHDPCLDPAAQYHVDAIGYLNGISTHGISNMTVQYCTIVDGNNNGIALQQGIYDHITMTHNYFANYGFTVAVWSGSSYITFTDNIFSTQGTCTWGPLYGTNFMSNPGGVWARNKWHSKDPVTGGNLGWGNAAHDGMFWAYTPGISPQYPPPQIDDAYFVSTGDYPTPTLK